MRTNEILRRPDGWFSMDGGLSWHHPAPNAAAPMLPSGLAIASTEQMREVDDALGLVELPAIRVSREQYEELVNEASASGIALQAHIRRIISDWPLRTL